MQGIGNGKRQICYNIGAMNDGNTLLGPKGQRQSPSTGDSAVRIEGVVREFASVKAVDGLSLALAPGEIMGFLGTNGAGKTTTIKMIIGLLRPSAGKVSVFGGDPSDPAVRARVGYMPEVATYYPYLTARELLAFYGGIC